MKHLLLIILLTACVSEAARAYCVKDDKDKSSTCVPIGVSIGTSTYKSLLVGGEVGINYFDRDSGIWASVYADGIVGTSEMIASAGFGFGWMLIGMDFGYYLIIPITGFKNGICIRGILNLPIPCSAANPIVAPFFRYYIAFGGENFMEGGLQFKFTI
ncbi:MAG: hypothetical protein GY754_06000 [bacterium]|nr:hypothetical protein [bacterium]